MRTATVSLIVAVAARSSLDDKSALLLPLISQLCSDDVADTRLAFATQLLEVGQRAQRRTRAGAPSNSRRRQLTQGLRASSAFRSQLADALGPPLVQSEVTQLLELLVRDSVAGIRQTAAGQITGAWPFAEPSRPRVHRLALTGVAGQPPGIARRLGAEAHLDDLLRLVRELSADSSHVSRGVLAEQAVAFAELLPASSHQVLLEWLAAFSTDEPTEALPVIVRNLPRLVAGPSGARSALAFVPPALAHPRPSMPGAGCVVAVGAEEVRVRLMPTWTALLEDKAWRMRLRVLEACTMAVEATVGERARERGGRGGQGEKEGENE